MTYDEQRDALIADMRGKMHREDWHGVADAANDLRELEAEWRGRSRISAFTDSRLAPGAKPLPPGSVEVYDTTPRWPCTTHGLVICNEFATQCPACVAEQRKRQS